MVFLSVLLGRHFANWIGVGLLVVVGIIFARAKFGKRQ